MNAIFIHIPKTAGLMIEEVLGLVSLRNTHRIKNNFRNRGRVSFGHMDYLMLRRHYVSDEFHRRAFKFCFCRSPYDRAVSHWAYAMRKHPDITAPGTSFLDFTRQLKEKERHPRRAFRHQRTWIDGVDVDFIGRFENLENDVNHLFGVLGIEPKPLPMVNSSSHPPYWEVYCEESKARIEGYYAPDFERFGYEHDDHLLHRQRLPS